MIAKIEIFTSPTCPHCPSAKSLAREIEKERDDVKVIEYSTITPEGSEKANHYQIVSVPTIIISGKEYVGLRGTPSKKGFNKAINLSLKKESWEDSKKIGFFEKFKFIFSS